MREDIGLFRGKRLDNGEWVEGYLVVTPEDKEGKEFAYWIISGLDYMGSIYDAPMAAEPVDPATIGEYTGLKDVEGKRIFEGDIIGSHGNVVEWCNGGFCVNGDIPLSYWAGALVIGSTHDNLELLEV